LLPLGRDRDSGLWEFAHLQTGEPPPKDANGKLDVQEGSCLVFVLVPGGRFLMGSQGTDPGGANYDPMATALGPVHRVSLTPFFLSKYEMTQGQWLRVTGSNPSHAGPHFWRPTWSRSGQMGDQTHPVEQVRWVDCVQVCRRIGCVLPSEARWEYGARGGTGTIWWAGNDVASLQGAGNLSDAYAESLNDRFGDGYDPVDDGYFWHAPVDSFRANPFGLHNVIGNVFEWCLDGMNDDFYNRCLMEEVVDPVGPDKLGGKMMRGGDFTLTSFQAKSANRGRGVAESANHWLGLRPACDIRGPVEYVAESASDK
jgi:formylglycine-generating enzyme required for sulfatase activity